MRRRILPVSLVLLGVAMLAGCGQKGPLALPTKPAAPASAASTLAPATSTAKPTEAATVATPVSAASGG